MGRRKRKHEEQENHERWIVSYADFITLLFAFFVVMYSISSVNEGKYRVLSQTLVEAFQDPSRSLDPIQIGELSRGQGQTAKVSRQNIPKDTQAVIKPSAQMSRRSAVDSSASKISAKGTTEAQRLSFLAAAISNLLEGYVEQKLVEVRYSDNRVMVDMKDKLLFPSASADLSRAASKVLRDLSDLLSNLPNQIQVEGNTDDRPIHTDEFPSNWELSAARAASVVHLMTRMGVSPERMSAIGYGEYRPVADNSTEEGRQKNRRVTLVVLGMDGGSDTVIQLPGN